MSHRRGRRSPRAAYQRRPLRTSVFGSDADRGVLDDPLTLDLTTDELLADLDSGLLVWWASTGPETPSEPDPADRPVAA